jgi:DNA-binding NtrC family response regulator
MERTRLYARFNRNVVFVGPVGAGKTTLAREVFEAANCSGRFVSVGCGELGETLYTDTLFGHLRGAYTGAGSSRDGALRGASDGVLLLDDLVLMPIAAQAAILRVIETGRYRPLGSARDELATCRILFASTVAPHELVASGRLLQDLASRLGEFIVQVPPLRARREDILSIAQEFAASLLREHRVHATVAWDEKVVEILRSYDWPGNVRELRSVVERAVVHAGTTDGVARVTLAHLPERIRRFDPSESTQKAELTANLIQRVVMDAGGNQCEAARRLGVHRNTIGRYLRSVG